MEAGYSRLVLKVEKPEEDEIAPPPEDETAPPPQVEEPPAEEPPAEEASAPAEAAPAEAPPAEGALTSKLTSLRACENGDPLTQCRPPPLPHLHTQPHCSSRSAAIK
eukprot:619622-Rhodomonas_salina.1